MKYEYPLTNNGIEPFLKIIVDDKIVDIEIINSEITEFHEKYVLGFWRDEENLKSLIQCINKLKITQNEQESSMLVDSALREMKSIYDIKKTPPGFEIDGSLYSTDEDKEGNIIRKLISHTPVWVPFQYHNFDTDSMMVDIAFYNNWSKMSLVTIPQKDAFQRRGIMEISAKGALLEESKANAMINWLVNYIHYNEIPINSVFERFGWKDNLVFVIGNKIISSKSETTAKIINTPTKSINGLSKSGSVDVWIEMTKKILKYDKARLKCYAACTAPLLKLLNQKSFILHDYGESSTGKTKTSELGMSIWGDPAKLIMSSFGTTVGKERLATLFTDLPILVDETQISSEEDNKIFIYLIANETGKLRGMKEGGLQDTANWKTVAFTTGEAPLTSDKSFMGMSMRVIEIYGGLGAHDQNAIDDFKIGVENCYGVLAPYIIHEIIENYNDLQGLFNQLNIKFNSLASELNTTLNGVGGRAASMFAVLSLGGIIFEEVLNKLGGDAKDAPNICAEIYRDYIETMARSGYSSRAYDNFMSWVHTKEKYFLVDMMEQGDKVPYDNYGNITDKYIDIYPTILKDVLEKAGFNYNRVMKDWQDNKILEMYIDSNNRAFSSHTIKFFNKSRKIKRVMIQNE